MPHLDTPKAQRPNRPRARLLALCAGVAMCAVGAAAASEKLNSDTPVARVGERAITYRALTRQLLTFSGKLASDRLIDRVVLHAEADRVKAEVTEADLSQRAAELKRTGGETLQKAIEAQGLSDEAWRANVRDELLAERVLDKKWPVKDGDLIRLQVRFCLVPTREKAKQIIQQVKQGQNFEIIALRESMEGRETGNLVAAEPFLRVDNPPFFAAATKANLRVGQISREPIESGKYFLVLRLEQYLGPETLTGRTREMAISRVRAYRLARLQPVLRQRAKIDRAVPLARLTDEPKLPDETVAITVGDKAITKKELLAYLYEQAGKTALGQLTERAITEQLAVKQGVTVNDGEVAERAAQAKKGPLGPAFQKALDAEGISEDAWKERVRFAIMAEKLVNARAPLEPDDLVRSTVRYIRVASKEDAVAIIQALKSGTPWEQMATRSLDRGEGYVRPRPFFRIEQPQVFQAVTEAQLQTGQVLPKPLDAGDAGFAVLRLESKLGAETLAGAERESAIRRITAQRMGPLLDLWRKEVRVDPLVPLSEMVAEARR